MSDPEAVPVGELNTSKLNMCDVRFAKTRMSDTNWIALNLMILFSPGIKIH